MILILNRSNPFILITPTEVIVALPVVNLAHYDFLDLLRKQQINSRFW